MHSNKPLKHSQQGQGMVEYAIMLILLITLVIGGIELAGATLASGKASDAAKAAVNDFATVNQKRLNAQENQQKYLRQLEILLNGGVVTVNENGLFIETDATTISSPTDDDPTYENFIKFLDSFSRNTIADGDKSWEGYLEFLTDTEANTEELFDRLITANISGATSYENLGDILLTVDGILDPNDDGVIDETDQDDDITLEELRCAVDTSCTFNILNQVKNLNPISDAEDDGLTSPVPYQIARYKALLLLEEIQLSILPLDPRADLSETIPLLGDHDPSTNDGLSRPSCDANANTYDYGFPTDDDGNYTRTLPEFTNSDGVVVEEAAYPAIYLFNPLPIQLVDSSSGDSCAGTDSDRDNQSRISVLVGGYGKEGDEFYEPGLPKLNTSFHGQYSHVCLDGANAYTRCGTANAAEEILKPPGKTCFSDTASDTVDSCTVDEPPTDTSGYYFWGQVNDQGNGKFSWTSDEGPVFRPTFQLVCNGDDVDLSNIINDECLDELDDDNAVANLKTIHVNVRYRHVFESFLTFGMMELDTTSDPDMAQYFYDPSNLRSPTVSVGTGIAGSELGPKASGKNPTVKQFKDFKGCYEINVETNQVGSCN